MPANGHFDFAEFPFTYFLWRYFCKQGELCNRIYRSWGL